MHINPKKTNSSSASGSGIASGSSAGSCRHDTACIGCSSGSGGGSSYSNTTLPVVMWIGWKPKSYTNFLLLAYHFCPKIHADTRTPHGLVIVGSTIDLINKLAPCRHFRSSPWSDDCILIQMIKVSFVFQFVFQLSTKEFLFVCATNTMCLKMILYADVASRYE